MNTKVFSDVFAVCIGVYFVSIPVVLLILIKTVWFKIPSSSNPNRNILNTIFVYSVSCSKSKMDQQMGESGGDSEFRYRYQKDTCMLYCDEALTVRPVRYHLQMVGLRSDTILIVSQKGFPLGNYYTYRYIDDLMYEKLQAKPVSFKEYYNPCMKLIRGDQND